MLNADGVLINTTLSSLLDKRPPVSTKLSKRKPESIILGSLLTLRAFRSTVRHLWKRTYSALEWSFFKSNLFLINQYHKLLITSKEQYFSNLVSSVSDNPSV